MRHLASGAPRCRRSTRASKRLAAAKTPVHALGGGALDAGKEALQIAETLNAPILTTTAGKGAVPANHPLSLGTAWLEPAARLHGISDAILCAGIELSETDFWRRTVIIDNNLIRIDIDAGRAGPAAYGGNRHSRRCQSRIGRNCRIA